MKRRTSTNKTHRVFLCVLATLCLVYYLVSQSSPESTTHKFAGPKSKFQGSLRSFLKGDSPPSKVPCTNVGCVEFPVHHNVLDQLKPEEAQKAREMCSKTYWHTMATTVKSTDQDDYFVFTGDIPHMWLRDSAAQIHGYLSQITEDKSLLKLVTGVVNRSAFYINLDPYGNAFSLVDEGERSQVNCAGCNGYVAEWKYELDSTCYFIRLIYSLWSTAKEIPDVLNQPPVHNAVNRILDLWITEQNHYNDSTLPNYFNVAINQSLYQNPGYYNELAGNGRGSPVAYTGLIWSGFRPSDDACQYGYLIPSNMFASVALGYIKILAKQLFIDDDMFFRATKLKLELDIGLKKHATVKDGDLVKKYGELYAYEVDGLGNSLLIDDANVPSLLGIPYLGYEYDPQIYANTRKFVLSPDNPAYFASANGKYKGVGSLKHTGHGNIWPMSQLMQGLTSRDPKEKLEIMKQLLASDAGTGWMHESYNADNPQRFTRSWFCWADALFAEFVMSMTDKDCRGPNKWPL